MTSRPEFLPYAVAALLAVLCALLTWQDVPVPSELEAGLAATLGAALALTRAESPRHVRRDDS